MYHCLSLGRYLQVVSNDSILMTILTEQNNEKFIFSGHQTFTLRFGWIKNIYDACQKIESSGGSISRDLFNNERSIVVLGVGKNMVAAMRHWAIYTKLLEVTKSRDLKITPRAHELFSDDGRDPWVENPATLWYLHYMLASNTTLFTYFYFFNIWNSSESGFEKNSFINGLKTTLANLGKSNNSDATIKRDVDCLLAMYSSKSGHSKINEESIESQLSELGLIHNLHRRDLYQKRIGPKSSVSNDTFLYVLLMFWQAYSPNTSSLSWDAICYEQLSPGRVLLLDANSVADYLLDIENYSDGLLASSVTSGLKQIILKKTVDFKESAFNFFLKNYK